MPQKKLKRFGRGVDRLIMGAIIGAAVGSVVGVAMKRKRHKEVGDEVKCEVNEVLQESGAKPRKRGLLMRLFRRWLGLRN